MEPKQPREGDEPIESLLREDQYAPEELARLLDMDVHRIEQAALNGRLQAEIVDHQVRSVPRAAAIEWARNGY